MLREMCFVLGTLGCASVSFSGVTVIDFDDIELGPGLPGTGSLWDGGRYSDLGVQFVPTQPGGEMYAYSVDHVESAPNAIYASRSGGLQADGTLNVIFDELQSFASFWVIDQLTGVNTEGEWLAVFFGEDGFAISDAILGTGSFLDGEGFVSFATEEPIIKGFQFVPSFEFEGIDTLVFGVPTPGAAGLMGLAALAGLRRRR